MIIIETTNFDYDQSIRYSFGDTSALRQV